jgi:hypothetical protein
MGAARERDATVAPVAPSASGWFVVAAPGKGIVGADLGGGGGAAARASVGACA